MAQEDDLRALGKVMDFMRGISVIFLLINCYTGSAMRLSKHGTLQ